MNTEQLKIGSIVKINKPHFVNGGHGKVGKIIDIIGQCYVVATSMEIFTCDFESIIIYNGYVSKSVKNIITYKKGYNYYFR